MGLELPVVCDLINERAYVSKYLLVDWGGDLNLSQLTINMFFFPTL